MAPGTPTGLIQPDGPILTALTWGPGSPGRSHRGSGKSRSALCWGLDSLVSKTEGDPRFPPLSEPQDWELGGAGGAMTQSFLPGFQVTRTVCVTCGVCGSKNASDEPAADNLLPQSLDDSFRCFLPLRVAGRSRPGVSPPGNRHRT